MKHILVDEIVETPTLQYGYIATNERVFQALVSMFTKKKLGTLLLGAIDKDTSDGLNMISKYCQFIVIAHITFGREFQGEIYFIDHKNQQYACLDDFSFVTIFSWSTEDRERYAETCMEIYRWASREKAELKKSI